MGIDRTAQEQAEFEESERQSTEADWAAWFAQDGA